MARAPWLSLVSFSVIGHVPVHLSICCVSTVHRQGPWCCAGCWDPGGSQRNTAPSFREWTPFSPILSCQGASRCKLRPEPTSSQLKPDQEPTGKVLRGYSHK